MSTADSSEPHHEIIIVRRGGGEDEGHHGGVWKIAFADFMTAMMCFFLVMWLINAANEQTKASVASYFNPVKLIDRNASRKGIVDLGDGPQAAETSADSPDERPQPPENATPALSGPAQEQHAKDAAADSRRFSDENLFSDPYAVLAEIAAETGTLQNISARGDGGAQEAGPASGASGGESYRDPFAPDFWSRQVAQPEDLGENPREGRTVLERGQPEILPAGGIEAFPESPPEPGPAAVAALPALAETPVEEAPEPAEETVDSAVERSAAAIRGELERAFASDANLLAGVSVVASRSGVVISLTDQLNYGMFEIGSAVPRRDLVLAMETIAGTIGEHPGAVRINGHTDGRPFRSADYDNWRLSTARAHSAYYMLVRAGLDEQRIREVAGFADRKLKEPSNPFADVNRRIEIIVEIGE